MVLKKIKGFTCKKTEKEVISRLQFLRIQDKESKLKKVLSLLS